MNEAGRRLVDQLRLACSGELAAARAYRGHWGSVRDPEERRAIQKIEQDEWHHRGRVREILRSMGARPFVAREWRAEIIGRVLGLLCYCTGWFLPMAAAARFERRGVREYRQAAEYARNAGFLNLADELAAMACVEEDHEHYFQSRVGKT